MKSIKRILFMLAFLLVVSCSEQKSFNSNEWKNWVETESTPNTRWLMHKDLLKKYNLKEMSKDSILNLLGEPNKKYSNKFDYYLGHSGRGINTGTMTIIFKDNLAVDIKVTDG